ncbi:hypothetical protein L6250_00710 [Candidatus Parcubacteria bacterium]|nr:hypothetical protein [Patescibacteria group bacterium]MCG2688148.1 hypothetical protein [Candidatus Parcubacteria bacterium]
MPNIAADIHGIHDVNTLHSAGKRSIPPTPKSAFLELYLRQNEKERLLKQTKRIKRQEEQVKKKLVVLDKNMAGLFKTATTVMKGLEKVGNTAGFPDKSTVLEYPK